MSTRGACEWSHESCNRSGWVGPGEPCPVCEETVRLREGLRWIAAGKTGSYGDVKEFARAILDPKNVDGP